MATVLEHEWDMVMEIAERCGVAHGERQDVALEVFLRYDQYRWAIASPMAIRSWLRTTAVHVSADIRNRKTARYEIPADPDGLEPENLVPSPEEQMSALEGHRELVKLIDALEPGRREVFRRYADQHHSMSLLSSELRIPQGTAYNRLRLAREELRAALARGSTGGRTPDVARGSTGGRTPDVAGPKGKTRRSFGVLSFALLIRLDFLVRVGRFLGEVWEWLATRGGHGRTLREVWAPVQIAAPVFVLGAAALGPPVTSPPAGENAVFVVSGADPGDFSRISGAAPGGVEERQTVSPGRGLSTTEGLSGPQRASTKQNVSKTQRAFSSQDVAARAAHMRLSLRTAHARLAAFSSRFPQRPLPAAATEPGKCAPARPSGDSGACPCYGTSRSPPDEPTP